MPGQLQNASIRLAGCHYWRGYLMLCPLGMPSALLAASTISARGLASVEFGFSSGSHWELLLGGLAQ